MCCASANLLVRTCQLARPLDDKVVIIKNSTTLEKKSHLLRFRSIIFAPVENKSITSFFLHQRKQKQKKITFVEDDDDDRCVGTRPARLNIFLNHVCRSISRRLCTGRVFTILLIEGCLKEADSSLVFSTPMIFHFRMVASQSAGRRSARCGLHAQFANIYPKAPICIRDVIDSAQCVQDHFGDFIVVFVPTASTDQWLL